MSQVCPACRLVQAGARCEACGHHQTHALARVPSEMLARKIRRPTLRRVTWQSMSLGKKILWVLAALVFILFGPFILPILMYELTGSVGAGLITMFTMLVAPWIVAFNRPVVRLLDRGRRQELAPLTAAPLLTDGEAHRGRVRALGPLVQSHLDDTPCVAAELRACDGASFSLRTVRATSFELVPERGEPIRVATPIRLEGDAATTRDLDRASLDSLGVPPNLKVPGAWCEIVLREGDVIEVHGRAVSEQVSAGYRDSAQALFLRGKPVVVTIDSRGK
jgi:hypothetical protein